MKKKRCDRNHIIYKITNKLTGEFYIGITQSIGRAYLGSIKKRWKQHVSRATTQTHEWSLCLSIREYGENAFNVEFVEVIRGKKPAHIRECELIKSLNPQLNTASIIKTI